jgi:hypothetical protein
MVTLMAELKTTRVQEIADEQGLEFLKFAARCMLRGVSYQTARDVWYGAKKRRGWNPTTKALVSKVLKSPVDEVFPPDE